MSQKRIPCNKRKPCPVRYICDPVEKTCIRRGDPRADVVVRALLDVGGPQKRRRTASSELYPPQWTTKGPFPGTRGFNVYVRTLLDAAIKSRHLHCPNGQNQNTDQWHQEVLKYLVHPKTPIHRLLAVWQLGTGKTLGMIRVLENFVADQRPKILVFPTDALVNNFYDQLMRFDSVYRKWVLQNIGTKPVTPEVVRDLLENCHRTGPQPLVAPLRAFRYTLAGGQTIKNNTVLRFGTADEVNVRFRADKNLFFRTIVLCDEAHNILKPREDQINRANRAKVANFGARLQHAEEAVIVLFTGTPIVDDPRDAQELLTLTMGHTGAGVQAPEGFVSWFMDRPSALFANAFPHPENMPLRIDAQMQGEILENYFMQRFHTRLSYKKKSIPTAPRVNDFPCVVPKSKCKGTIASYENHAFYFRIKPKKALTMQNAHERATKAYYISQAIQQDKENLKTCVILHEESGAYVLVKLLTELGISVLALEREKSVRKSTTTDNALKINQFNNLETNLRGESHRVIVLTAENHSEGVSLLNVRRLVLGDLSPGNTIPRWSLVQQRMGRALRMCSHVHLPLSERTLRMEVFVATHRVSGFPKTLDEEKYDLIEKERPIIQTALDTLRGVSIDAGFYS